MTDWTRLRTTDEAMRSVVVGGLFVILHPNSSVSREEWDEHQSFFESQCKLLRGMFVYTLGGGPNAGQRREIQRIFGQLPDFSSAVVTPSVLVRSIVTAINFFRTDRFKMFAPTEMNEAFAYVSASESERQDILTVIARSADFLHPAKLQQNSG